jgi:hypothetical protein
MTAFDLDEQKSRIKNVVFEKVRIVDAGPSSVNRAGAR